MGRFKNPAAFPPVIPVCGNWWHIIWVKQLAGGKEMGQCIWPDRIIYIARDQPHAEYEPTLWHELLHAFEYETGLKLGHARINKLEYTITESRVWIAGWKDQGLP